MTAQISDKFRYKDDIYSIVAMSSAISFSPTAYGIKPDFVCTACWRGYWCEYVITKESVILDNLYINSHDGKYPAINGVEAHDADLMGHHAYEGLNLKIPHSGKILIGKDFIQKYYIHMGYQRAWSYQTLVELVFENGILTEENDYSELAAEIRSKCDSEDEHGNDISDCVTRLVKDCLSSDIDTKVWWLC